MLIYRCLRLTLMNWSTLVDWLSAGLCVRCAWRSLASLRVTSVRCRLPRHPRPSHLYF